MGTRERDMRLLTGRSSSFAGVSSASSLQADVSVVPALHLKTTSHGKVVFFNFQGAMAPVAPEDIRPVGPRETGIQ